MGKILIYIGTLLIISGLFWQFGSKLGLGKLPGDFSFKSENTGFYFPLASSILISVVLSLLLWLFRFFKGE